MKDCVVDLCRVAVPFADDDSVTFAGGCYADGVGDGVDAWRDVLRLTILV